MFIPGIGRRCLAALCLPLACLSWHCAGTPEFTTARMPGRGGIEVSPYAAKYFKGFAPFGYKTSQFDEAYLAGGLAAYGLTESLALNIRYGWLQSSNYGGDHILGLGLKRSLSPDRHAVAGAYGYYFGNDLHRFDFTSYTDYGLGRWARGCISPKISVFYLAGPARGKVPARYFPASGFTTFNGTLNNSLTLEIGRHLYMRPEIGFGVYSLMGEIVFHAGLAAGARF